MNRLFMFAVALMIVLSPAQAASTRHMVFVSDLHVGAGKLPHGGWNRIEDFRWQNDFNSFLDMVSKRSGDRADLVLLGDVFELWQSPTMVCSTDVAKPGCEVPDCNDADTEIGCSETDAVARLNFVLERHPDFIAAIREFAARGNNTVHFVPGNHDGALTFPLVRDALLARFPNASVSIEANGYWLSSDGIVFGDHGHQFDDLNAFPDWPKPFVHRNGRSYLSKPWGENMVQRFYNQYESVYPIIDNLSDEKSGAWYAVQQAGFRNSAEAVRRFFRFFLYEESLAQAVRALGKDEKIGWDYKGVRDMPVNFFIDLFPVNMRPAPQQLAFTPSTLTNDEIDAICTAKTKQDKGAPCPRLAQGLGAAATAFISDETRQKAYLRTVLPKVAGAGKPVARVYVHGHTHHAVEPNTLTLSPMQYGDIDVTTVNTGAFQRITSPDQIQAILRQPGNAGRRPLDLDPEDLPACYTFVWIEPYLGSKALPQLFRWSKGGAGFTATPGSCL